MTLAVYQTVRAAQRHRLRIADVPAVREALCLAQVQVLVIRPNEVQCRWTSSPKNLMTLRAGPRVVVVKHVTPSLEKTQQLLLR